MGIHENKYKSLLQIIGKRISALFLKDNVILRAAAFPDHGMVLAECNLIKVL